MKRRNLVVWISLFFASTIQAQQVYLPLNRTQNLAVDQYVNQQNRRLHTSSKPLITFFTGIDRPEYDHIQNVKERNTWFGRKVKSENFALVRTKDFFLTVDPLFDLSIGEDDFTNYSTYLNTRGIIFTGEVNNKVHFFTSFYENQAFFPQYLSQYINTFGVVPGSGRVKPFKTEGFDFAMASAMVSFNVWERLNIQLGHHKNFIGEGYRSLLLSDNAFNYPHLKLSYLSANGRWLYQSTFASLIDLNRLSATTSSEAQFERKAGAFHYLNYLPANWLSIGLFEGIVWQTRTPNGNLPFNANILNPLIFFNSAFNGFDTHRSENQLGLNVKVKPFNNHLLYGQFLLGGLGSNEQGFQIGYKWFDALGLENLTFQTEFNQVNFAVSSNTAPVSFSHYEQPLGFAPITIDQELLAFVDYQLFDFFISGKVSFGMVAQTPFARNNAEAKVGYLLNKQTGLNVSIGYLSRGVTDTFLEPFGNANTITLNLSTRLHNRYFDF